MTSFYGGSLKITRTVPLNNHVKSFLFAGLGTKYLIKIVQIFAQRCIYIQLQNSEQLLRLELAGVPSAMGRAEMIEFFSLGQLFISSGIL